MPPFSVSPSDAPEPAPARPGALDCNFQLHQLPFFGAAAVDEEGSADESGSSLITPSI